MAFAVDEQGAVPAVDVEVADVSVERFGDPQAVQSEQTRERMVAAAGQPSLDKEGSELVAVKPERG